MCLLQEANALHDAQSGCVCQRRGYQCIKFCCAHPPGCCCCGRQAGRQAPGPGGLRAAAADLAACSGGEAPLPSRCEVGVEAFEHLRNAFAPHLSRAVAGASGAVHTATIHNAVHVASAATQFATDVFVPAVLYHRSVAYIVSNRPAAMFAASYYKANSLHASRWVIGACGGAGKPLLQACPTRLASSHCWHGKMPAACRPH
jgi:hypothetical protein